LASAVNKFVAPSSEIEFQQAKKQIAQEVTGYGNINVQELDYEHKGDIFGLPVFMPVILEAFDDTVNDLLLDSAVVEIARTKNIVTTVVQGRDTSVKEFINNGDFTVKISGIIASEGIDYPKEKVLELHKYLEHNQSIKVVNEKLNALDIFELVITDYSIPPSTFTNIQPYSFNCLSEKPVELIIDEK
jgi:hypothetical protein